MRRAFVFVAIGFVCLGSKSQCVLTKEFNLPLNNDKLMKQRIEYFAPGAKGENLIWDISNLTLLDNDYSIKYISSGDTLFNAIEHRTVYEYKLKGDTLFWSGFENKLTKLTDSVPAVAMVFPMSYGCKVQQSFYQKGIYSQTLPLSANGNSTVEADSYGSLIMHDGDTLRNVLRVHKCYTSHVRMSKINNELPIDTIRDTLVKHIEDVYSWYAEGYRYPIVETVKHIYKDKDKVIDNFGTSFLCSLEEQASNTNDIKNIKGKEKVRSNNRQESENSSNNKGSELLSDDPVISQTDENIIISLISPFSGNIELILTDMYGRVFNYKKEKMVSGESVEINLNKDGLIPGEYLLYMGIGKKKIPKKFIIR